MSEPLTYIYLLAVLTSDADNDLHCGGSQCGGLYSDVLKQAVYFATLKSAYLGAKSGILAIGVNGQPALRNFQSWLTVASITEPVTYMTDTTLLATVDFTAFKVLYVPSAEINANGGIVNGISNAQNNVLVARKADIANYVNSFGGSYIVLGQSSLTNAYKWLPVPLVYVPAAFINVDVTPDLATLSATSTGPNLSHWAWHGYFTGPPDWSGTQS